MIVRIAYELLTERIFYSPDVVLYQARGGLLPGK
jgi:hypoxanthine phosphoribosyltransferase